MDIESLPPLSSFQSRYPNLSITNSSPPEPPPTAQSSPREPEIAVQYDPEKKYVDAGFMLCDAMHTTGMVTSDDVNRLERVVEVGIRTYEEATICWGSVAILAQ